MPRILLLERPSEGVASLATLLSDADLEWVRAPAAADVALLLGESWFDVLVTEQRLDGVRGTDVCRQVKANEASAGVRVLVLTREDRPADAVLALAAGADGLLNRFHDEGRIVARIEELAVEGGAASGPSTIEFEGESHRVRSSGQRTLDILGPALERSAQLNQWLTQSEERLRAVFEGTADGVVTVTEDGYVDSSNAAAKRIFGRTEFGLTGEHVACVLPCSAALDDAPALECLTDLLPKRDGRIAPGETELEVQRPDGGGVPVAVEVEECRLVGETVFIVTVRDLKDRRAAQAANERAEARQREVAARDRLLSHVSHELRTPLAAVHQYVELLHDGVAGPITEEQRELLAHALRNARQLGHMIGDLMDVARADAGKILVRPAVVTLADVVQETVSAVHGTAGADWVTIHADVSTALPLLFVDRARLRQVLTNLLENAVKFTPRGGRIDVRAGPYERDPTLVQVDVTDTGPGIAAKDRETVFERLGQVSESIDSRRKGLGLGLAICRDIVRAQGGRIWVDSAPGEGSTFSFTSPVATPSRLVESLPAEGAPFLVAVRAASVGGDLDESRRRRAETALGVVASDEGLVLLPPLERPDGAAVYVLVGRGGDAEEALARVRTALEGAAPLDGIDFSFLVGSVEVRHGADSMDELLAVTARRFESSGAREPEPT